MIDAREELPDVTFQNPAGSSVVLACLVSENAEAIQGLVRPLPDPAGEGIADELSVKIQVQHSVNGVMDEAIADACFVDVSRLRVGNIEGLIAAVAVGSIDKVTMKCEDVIHETQAEFLHVELPPLAGQEFPPSFKQILNTYYLFKHMSIQKSNDSVSIPPPLWSKPAAGNPEIGNGVQVVARDTTELPQDLQIHAWWKNRQSISEDHRARSYSHLLARTRKDY